GNSFTYINPDQPNDHKLNVGDWVQSKPGVSNSKNVRNALDVLQNLDITVPVWDQSRGSGANAAYHIVAFAQVRLLDYRLSGQNRISARFLGYSVCGATNEAPIANALSITNDENTSVSFSLTGFDVEGAPLTYAVLSSPAHGTLSGTAPNLTYQPATDYFGPDAFTFRVNDG